MKHLSEKEFNSIRADHKSWAGHFHDLMYDDTFTREERLVFRKTFLNFQQKINKLEDEYPEYVL